MGESDANAQRGLFRHCIEQLIGGTVTTLLSSKICARFALRRTNHLYNLCMGLIGLLSDQTERNLNQITTSVAPVIDYAGTPAVPVSRLGGCSGSLGDDNGWIASKFRQHDPSLFYINNDR